MNMTPKEYNRYVARLAKKSPLGKDLLNSFLIGGLICVVGQLILNGYTALDLSEQDAAAATSVSLVFLSAVLTALSVYDDLAKIAGAGTLVPITGFANAVVSPAIEFKAEGFVTGMAAKMFIIAGPVIVYGTVASVLYGVILVIFGG
jgi:stage V sporulation protein AC